MKRLIFSSALMGAICALLIGAMAPDAGALLVTDAAAKLPSPLCSAGIFGPNDPDYAPAELSPKSGQTFNGEQWYLYDCIPQSTPHAIDPERTAGMSVNAAWKTFGMGRSDVII